MSLKYLLMLLLGFIGVSCFILLVVFLASVLMSGSYLLPVLCLFGVFLFFGGIKLLHKI